MHLPELTVGAGKFRSFRGWFGVRMHLREREVSEDEAQFFPKVLLHAFDDGMRMPTVGTFVIAVLHQSAFRVRTTLDVVVLVDGDSQTHGQPPVRFLFGKIFQRVQDSVGPWINGYG